MTSRFSNVGWAVMATVVAMIAGMAGGPNAVGEDDRLNALRGADPKPDCDTTDTVDNPCPSAPGKKCSALYQTCLEQSSGVLQTERCIPKSDLVCSSSRCVDTKQDKLSEDECNEVTPPDLRKELIGDRNLRRAAGTIGGPPEATQRLDVALLRIPTDG